MKEKETMDLLAEKVDKFYHHLSELVEQLRKKTRRQGRPIEYHIISKKKKRTYNLLLLICLLLLAPHILYSATITSATTGNWSDGSTWIGGVAPDSTDNIIIGSGHTVTLVVDIKMVDLTVNSSAVLTDGGLGKQIVCTGNLVVDGTITIDGAFDITGEGTTIDGTGTISGMTKFDVMGYKTVLATANLTFSGALLWDLDTLLTNDGAVTTTVPLTSDGPWIQGVNATLNYNHSADILCGLNASAVGNTVNYGASGSQNIKVPDDGSYYNFQTSGTGSKSLLAATDVNGNLTITGTAQLDASSFDITFAGNWLNNSSHSNPFSEGTQTVTMDGGLAQTITATGGEIFYNLTINKTANGVTLNDAITVNNNFKLTVGDLDDNGNQITGNTSGIFSIAANCTLTLGSAPLPTLCPTNFTAANTTLNGASTVIYNSDMAQAISSVPSSYGNLMLSSTSAVVKSIDAAINVNGTLTINTNNTLDVSASNYNITVAGNWINNGTFTEGTCKVTFDGSGDQTIDNTSDETFCDLTVNKEGGQLLLAADTDIIIKNSLTLTNGILKTNNFTNNEVRITNNASSTSGNANSFIHGKITKTGNQAFTFPLGDAAYSKWARLSISAPSIATTEYTAQYTYTPYSDTTTDASLFNASILEYWTLDQAVNNDDVQVTLFWEDSAKSGMNDCASSDLVVARFNGSDWTDEGQFSIVCSKAGNVTSNVVASYSPFTFGSKSGSVNPLPIALHSFNAELNGDQVDLTWATGFQSNNDYFTVQKSVDGIDFENVTDVSGGGNSSQMVYYTATDTDVYDGNSYYRVKHTDYDGIYAYSKIVMVHYAVEDPLYNVAVYPNPANGDFYVDINGEKDGEVLVVVLDMLGNKHYSKVIVPTDNVYTLGVDPSGKLLPGVYFIVASSRSELYRNTLVIH